MAPGPVRAASGWLRLREPADAEARSRELVEILRTHLADGPLEIHDLGGGTGSMARWLAPRLDGPQQWVLHDRDAELLELATGLPVPRARDGAVVTLATRTDDITRLHAGELASASLVTASALLDMFTDDEVDRFAAACADAGCPVLLTLSVVGRVQLRPAEPLDRRVMAAFNAHQARPSPGGRLLGPGAAAATSAALRGAGLEVVQRSSPWHLRVDHAALLGAWFTGWTRAALEQDPGLAAHLVSYLQRRRAQLAAGSLSATVDHVDLLALPGR
jgi:hypothetical protein